MMISPQMFYNNNVKGKTLEEVVTLFKQKVKHVNELEEKIKKGELDTSKPSLATQLTMNKEYLKTILNEITEKLINKAKSLPQNSEISLTELMSEVLGKNALVEFSSEELWQFQDTFFGKLGEENIMYSLPDRFIDKKTGIPAKLGLPYNIPYLLTKVESFGNIIFSYTRKASCGFCGKNYGDFKIEVYDSGIVKHKTFTFGNNEPESSCIHKIDDKTLSKVSNLIDKHKAKLNKFPNRIETGVLDGHLDIFEFKNKIIQGYVIKIKEINKVKDEIFNILNKVDIKF